VEERYGEKVGPLPEDKDGFQKMKDEKHVVNLRRMKWCNSFRYKARQAHVHFTSLDIIPHVKFCQVYTTGWITPHSCFNSWTLK
jgi:hypothetical protein